MAAGSGGALSVTIAPAALHTIDAGLAAQTSQLQGRTSSVHSFLALAARGVPMHIAHASCSGCRHTADCNKAADRIVKGAGDLDQRSVRPIEPDSDIQTAHDQ